MANSHRRPREKSTRLFDAWRRLFVPGIPDFLADPEGWKAGFAGWANAPKRPTAPQETGCRQVQGSHWDESVAADFDPWKFDLRQLPLVASEEMLLQALAAQEVLLNRPLIKAEPSYALVAIEVLYRGHVPVPTWVSQLVADRVRRIQRYEVGSLDACFNFAKATNKHLEARRKQLEHCEYVHTQVLRIVASTGADITEAITEVAAGFQSARGKKNGRDTCQRMYAFAVERLGLIDIRGELVRRFGEESGKQRHFVRSR